MTVLRIVYAAPGQPSIIVKWVQAALSIVRMFPSEKIRKELISQPADSLPKI